MRLLSGCGGIEIESRSGNEEAPLEYHRSPGLLSSVVHVAEEKDTCLFLNLWTAVTLFAFFCALL